mmetsp:Transcript_34835/g.45869  ORF Transcript_34835/g.45869 Transcript_34835/m.45869 type:complete len:105 (-) Transcript_34835:125-439(-)
MQALQSQFQNKMLTILSEPTKTYMPKRSQRYHVGDSEANSSMSGYFSWPSEDDLESLSLVQPLQITAVKTKGDKSSGYLSAIQLIFENGISSPLFDGKCTSADD